MRVALSLLSLSLFAAAACGPSPGDGAAVSGDQSPGTAQPPRQPVVVTDEVMSSEGGMLRDFETTWTWDGEWLVSSGRRVPGGVIERLRELAVTAPDVEGAPLPEELGITREALDDERVGDITDAASGFYNWVTFDPEPEPAVTFEIVEQAARDQLIDDGLRTGYSGLSVTLPGTPPITISSNSIRAYLQPWQVVVGESEPRTVLSLEISRFVALLVDPRSGVSTSLQGAAYWRDGFWRDSHVWQRVFGRPWVRQRALQWCAEIEGWEDVATSWQLERADLAHWALTGASLRATLVSRPSGPPGSEPRGSGLIDVIEWHNPLQGEHLDEVTQSWRTMLELHAAVEDAARRLPCIAAWKSEGVERTIRLDAVGDTGHDEPQTEFFHDPVWRDSGLAGTPDFELTFVIGEERVAGILFGRQSDGAVVLHGHASLTAPHTDRFHPTTGGYTILRADGGLERRKMPPVTPRFR